MRFIVFIFLSTIMFLFSCAGPKLNQNPERSGTNSLQYYQSALNHFENGDLDSALMELEMARSIKQNYAPYYFLTGKIYMIKAQPEEALQYFEHALKLKSFYPEVWQDIAQIYFARGDYENASRYFTKLAAYTPQKELYTFQIVRCSNRQGKPEAALLQLDELRQKNIYFDGFYFEYAKAYMALKQMDNAVRFFQQYYKIHEKNPGEEELLFGAGLYETITQYETMLSLANKGLELYTQNPLWYYYRIIYFLQKRNDKAQQLEFSKMLDLIHNKFELIYRTGNFFCLRGKTDMANLIFESISDLQSLDNESLTQLSQTCLRDDVKIKVLKVLYDKTGDKNFKNQIKQLSGE